MDGEGNKRNQDGEGGMRESVWREGTEMGLYLGGDVEI